MKKWSWAIPHPCCLFPRWLLSAFHVSFQHCGQRFSHSCQSAAYFILNNYVLTSLSWRWFSDDLAQDLSLATSTPRRTPGPVLSHASNCITMSFKHYSVLGWSMLCKCYFTGNPCSTFWLHFLCYLFFLEFVIAWLLLYLLFGTLMTDSAGNSLVVLWNLAYARHIKCSTRFIIFLADFFFFFGTFDFPVLILTSCCPKWHSCQMGASPRCLPEYFFHVPPLCDPCLPNRRSPCVLHVPIFWWSAFSINLEKCWRRRKILSPWMSQPCCYPKARLPFWQDREFLAWKCQYLKSLQYWVLGFGLTVEKSHADLTLFLLIWPFFFEGEF